MWMAITGFVLLVNIDDGDDDGGGGGGDNVTPQS
jgi:hypothetical protein